MSGTGSSGTAASPAGSEALLLLAERAAGEGPPLEVVPGQPAAGPPLAALVAAGTRTAGTPGAYSFVVEAVREGYLCHYETSRILDRPDSDLALLAGDLFYAIGISALAGLDDVESVGLLSDLIRVAAELRSQDLRDEAESMWVATIMALSCGWDGEYERLRAGLSGGNRAAAQALDDWTTARAKSNGLGRILAEVREAIHFQSDT